MSAPNTAPSAPPDPLPSWRDGPTKRAILSFAAAAADPSSPGFLPEPQRVAAFDNDGTLWVEQPAYTQLAFALDRLRHLAPSRPEWRESPALAAALDGDIKAVAATGMKGLAELVAATHAGMTADEFSGIVSDWIATAKHPRFGRPYTDLVYQPMLEVLSLLRAGGFKTYIVTGGGAEFVRPWAEAVYGVPPENVVGSCVETEWVTRGDGTPALVRLPKVAFVNDGPGKPVGISQHIGRRPAAAFGNSDGDLQMLQYTTGGTGGAGSTAAGVGDSGDAVAAAEAAKAAKAAAPRLGVLLHHTDGDREYAYDRASRCGRLDKALGAAAVEGWVVVDMARDWRRVFPWEAPAD